jgi:heavy metal translocating P-type ATPase
MAVESVLSRLQQLVDEAQREKAPLQRLADRVSRIFVPSVLALAVTTFVVWWFVLGDHDTAVLSALSVLLVACPCAMGLAAPMAMMVGCGSASALGIFVRNGDVLERLSRVDTVVFDKTGTLTERHAKVTDVLTVTGITPGQLLELAGAVEAESDHPIALAILEKSQGTMQATEIQVVPGVGVAGLVGRQRVQVSRLEHSRLPGSLATGVAARYAKGDTVVLVERDQVALGAIAVATPLRAEALPSVHRLQNMGLNTAILSGDSDPAVRTIGAELGIGELHSALSPGGKVDVLRGLRCGSRGILMVGDGVNDAPALAAADIGCAIGSGSEAALANSDVALLGNDLFGVPAAINLARATYAIILQNFGWAIGYNIAALPLAAVGLIDPLVAALAMGMSSLLVVANSLRLGRLGRSGLRAVSTPRLDKGRRSLVLSVALPIVVFAGLVVISQIISPARGQTLLPELPTITTINLVGGGTAEVYLNPGSVGVNEFHVFIYPPKSTSRISDVTVTAAREGQTSELLRHLRLAADHYVNYVLLTPGKWNFHVVIGIGGRTDSFHTTRTIS